MALLDEGKLKKLHNLYKEGRLVLLIGAGLSKPFDMPSWSELLTTILDNLTQLDDSYINVCKNEIIKGRFFKAIDIFKDEGGLQEDEIKEKVADIVKQRRRRIDRSSIDCNYSDIAKFGFNVILTTNYDELLFPYLMEGEYAYAYNRPLALSEFHYPQKLDREKYVFQLHGEVSRPETIVLSEESYDALYEEEYYRTLFKYIGMSKTILFLGNSLTDVYINGLLAVLKKEFHTTHYVVLPRDEAEKNIDVRKKLGVETIPYIIQPGSNSVKEIRKILTFILEGKEPGDDTADRSVSDKRIEAEKQVQISLQPVDEVFIGRSDEIALCEKLLHGELDGKNVIAFSGKRGIGKTRLFKEIERHCAKCDSSFVVKYGSATRGKAQSLADFLNECVDGSLRLIADDTDYLFNFVNVHNNCLVLIDEFPCESEEFIKQFEMILLEIEKKKSNIYFVINSIKHPNWSACVKNKIMKKELKPFTSEEVREYLDKKRDFIDDNDYLTWIDKNIENVTDYVEGCPQLFNLVFVASGVKEIVKSSDKDTFSDKVNEVLDCIAGTLPEKVTDALSVLSVVSMYETEWEEKLAVDLYHKEWGGIADPLFRNGLLIKSVSKLKLHDYVSEFFVGKIMDDKKEKIHNQLAAYYLRSDNSQKYTLALSHLISAFKIKGHYAELEKKFGLICRQMCELGRQKKLYILLRPFYEDVIEKSELLPVSFWNAVQYQYALSLSDIGYADKAIQPLEKLKDAIGENQKEYRDVLTSLADCYRLTGRLDDCVKMCREVVQLCPKCINKCDSNAEEIIERKCKLAHSFYLFGDFNESAKRFANIIKEHDEELKTFDKAHSDLCYRYSKTLRVQGKALEAKNWAEKALQFATSAKQKSYAEWALCAAYNFLGEYELAMDAYANAKKCFEEMTYRAAIFVEYDLAETLKLQGDFEKAIYLYERAIKQTTALNEQNRRAFALLGKADVMRWKIQSADSDKVVRDACDYYEEAKKIFEKIKLEFGCFMCDFGLILAKQEFGYGNDEMLKKLLKTADSRYPREEEIISQIINTQKIVPFPLNII